MTISEIINYANSLADEQIQTVQVRQWVNDAFAKFNIWWPAMVPVPSGKDEDEIWITREVAPYEAGKTILNGITEAQYIKRYNQFKSVNDSLLARLIYPYVTYQIKVNDSSEFEYLDRLKEWEDDIKKAKTLFEKFLNPDYTFDGGVDITGDGTNDMSSAKVAVSSPESFVYGPENTWSEDPGVGVTPGGNYRADSKNPFGIGDE